MLAVLAAWLGFQYWPRQGRLASGGYNEDFSDMMEAKGSMLELPEGHSCDIHERKGDDVTCVPHATWQQLMVAKVCLRLPRHALCLILYAFMQCAVWCLTLIATDIETNTRWRRIS